MSSKECPGCGKAVPLEARNCPYCPESFPDEDDPLPTRRSSLSIDMGSWPIWAWLLMFALLGTSMWRFIVLVMMSGADSVNNPVHHFVDQHAGSSVAEVKNYGSGSGVNAMFGNAIPTFPDYSAKKGAAGHSAAGSTAPGQSAPPAEDEVNWHFSGIVFDLLTLQPIADCEIVVSASGHRKELQTDDTGRYEAVLPPLEHGGYDVVIKHDGYARNYLNPGAEKVPMMSLEDRQGLAHDLNQSNDGPYQVEGVGPAPVVTDFYLAPLSSH